MSLLNHAPAASGLRRQQAMPRIAGGAAGRQVAQPMALPAGAGALQLQMAKSLPGPRSSVASQATVPATAPAPTTQTATTDRKMKVLIAGAGIGGLVLGVSLLKQGFDVQVFERDLTAVRGEGKYRGPIQVQSNALAALEAIDEEAYAEVLTHGCITGDRVNGLCDGFTGEWYVKFDTFHPAVEAGLPITRVISRITLQEVLAKTLLKLGGQSTIMNGAHVTSFAETTNATTGHSQVSVTLESGEVHHGDLLVGADGIWSKIRKQLIGETQPNYSGYTCYTGISDFMPADIDIVGYRVFLGNGLYFVSSDVGGGKMQWYAFHKEAAGGSEAQGTRKRRLLQLFGHWNDNVVDLVKATPEEDILRRDIFDRAPIFSWAEGRVALLGDSAHAMQPNLGQGGGMAIEDGYALAMDLTAALEAKGGDVAQVHVPSVLKQYQNERLVRVSAIHGMAGAAAFAASTYKCFLGEGWQPWVGEELAKKVMALRIPHPGRVVGRVAMLATMPLVLQWVLGGNTGNIKRAGYCRLDDTPRAFPESMFKTFMNSDRAITEAAHADWLLVSERAQSLTSMESMDGLPTNFEAEASFSSSQLKGIYISDQPSLISGRIASMRAASAAASAAAAGAAAGPSGHAGGGAASTSGQLTAVAQQHQRLLVDDSVVSDRHAQVWREGVHYFLQDLGSDTGTWHNGKRLEAQARVELEPSDKIEFGSHPAREVFKVKMQHVTLRTDELTGLAYKSLIVGKRAGAAAGEYTASNKVTGGAASFVASLAGAAMGSQPQVVVSRV